MRLFVKLLYILLTFVTTPLLFASDECNNALAPLLNPAAATVQALPVFWISTYGGDVKSAGAYQLATELTGAKMHQHKLLAALNGTPAHLRLHKMPSGIRYVSIHTDNGEEIFDDHEYGGLFSCNCGAIHKRPVSQMATAIRGADLGDGFKLKMTIAGEGTSNGPGTASYVNKEYQSNGFAVDFSYSLQSTPTHDRIGDFNAIFEMKESSDILGVDRKPYIEIRTRLVDQISTSVTIGYNLTLNKYSSAFDQMTFNFDADGKLSTIDVFSESLLDNPHWPTQILDAIKKGSNKWVEYKRGHPTVNLLFEEVFGVPLIQPSHVSGTRILSHEWVVHRLNAAATAGITIDLKSLFTDKRGPSN